MASINIDPQVSPFTYSGGVQTVTVSYDCLEEEVNTPVVSDDWISIEQVSIYRPYYTTIVTYNVTVSANTGVTRVGDVKFSFTGSSSSAASYNTIRQGGASAIDVPILCDVFYDIYETNIFNYTITHNGNLIYRGRSYRSPDSEVISINVAKVCRDYIYQHIDDFRGVDSDVLQNNGAYGEFAFCDEFGTELQRYRFLYQYTNDWTGETGYMMSEPVNGHISPFMKLMVTQYDGLDNWSVDPKRDLHPEEYLTFNVLSEGYIWVYSIAYAPSFWYSVNGGDWVYKSSTSAAARTFTIDVKPGDKVRVKSNCYTTHYPSDPIGMRIKFYRSTASYYLTGNIKSLTQEDNFMDDYYAHSGVSDNIAFNYDGLFQDVGLVDASQLVMPEYVWKKQNESTPYTKKSGCYISMFNNCINLVYPPLLPAKELEQGCYTQMFSNCRSLLVPPILSVPEPEPGYYYAGICSGCTSLIRQPIIPQ